MVEGWWVISSEISEGLIYRAPDVMVGILVKITQRSEKKIGCVCVCKREFQLWHYGICGVSAVG